MRHFQINGKNEIRLASLQNRENDGNINYKNDFNES